MLPEIGMEGPGFFFCICPDAAFLREYMDRELLAPLFSADGDASRVDVQTFWADEGLDRRFWDALTLLSMDGRRRVLIVRGAQQLPADTWKKLSVSGGRCERCGNADTQADGGLPYA